MKKYAVIGNPIKHSLSPEMHNANFKALGLDSVYEKICVEDTKEKLEEFANYARKNLSGFNITVPFKSKIIQVLDAISDVAKLADSVNTVSVIDGELYGTTTDGFGLEQGIKEEFDIEIRANNFIFIGCGGAVQAVACHFASCGAKNLYFANRTLSKAKDLSEKINSYSNWTTECKACSLDDIDNIESFISNSSVLIQGTSLGLNDTDPSPISENLLKNINVFDTIYKETALLKAAKLKGLKSANGRSMLLYQGAKAFEIWTGIKPMTEIMKKIINFEC